MVSGRPPGKHGVKRATTIRRKADFNRLYSSGKRYHTPLLTAVILRRGDDEPACRVAYVVGRKVARQAVIRNRVRRRLREAYRSLGGPLEGGADLALIAHPAAAAADYWGLRAALGKALERAGLLSLAPPGGGAG